MARKADPADRIIDAALELAAEPGWARTSLADISARANLPLAEARRHFDSKAAILRAFLRRIDAQVLAAVGPGEAGESARDRLFDLMMARFEALLPYRRAIRSLFAAAQKDPIGAACLLPTYCTSMAWMLEGAGVSSAGLKGALRANGLAALNLAVSQTWLKDDSADLGKTMASLDRWLARAEWLERASRTTQFRRRRPAERPPTRPEEGTGPLAAEDLS